MSLAAILARQKTNSDSCLSVPGVWDGFTASLAEQAGFNVLFLSGAALSMARLGKPDLGFHALETLADAVQTITSVTETPLLVDADTGFGNALHVQNTVRRLEAAGASAIQIEDQTWPKRCGHLKGKTVISASEATEKIKAAVDARRSGTTMISARTDAVATEGLESAIARGHAYIEAGADMLFIEGPAALDDMRRIKAEFAHRVPLIHNLVEGGSSPVVSRQELSSLGYAIALHPLLLLSALSAAAEPALAHLREHGESVSLAADLPDLPGLNSRLGLDAYLETGRQYGDDT